MNLIRLVASITIYVSACAFAGQNLLKNGSFEERDPANRTYPHFWAVQTADTASLKFSGDHRDGATSGMMTGDGKEYLWRQDVLPSGSRQFTLTAFVHGDEVKTADGEFARLEGQILYRGKSPGAATQFAIDLPSGGYDWKLLSVTAEAKGPDDIEKIQISVHGKFSGGRLWVDKVELTDGAALSAEEMLARKIEDLDSHLAAAGDVDSSVAEARQHLSTARKSLASGAAGMTAATSEWILAAQSVSHTVWAKLFPEAMTDKTTEARMIYHGGLAETKEATDASFDAMQAAGCNGTFHSLGAWSSAIYPSKLLPIVAGFEKRDALAYSIQEAKRRNIKSFGYLAMFYGTTSPPTGPGSIYTLHPDWFAKGPDPRMPTFPDPANPAVVDYVVRIYVELATNYDLDGIGLDFIRYPTETALNYDENNRSQIMERYGTDILDGGRDVSDDPVKWAKIKIYRAEKIANVIKRVHDAVKAVRPKMSLIGCMVAEPDTAAEYGQDWTTSAESLEYATPMNYDDRSADALLLAQQHDILQKSGSVFLPSIGGMPEVHEAWTISTWAERVALQRKVGCDGLIIYRMSGFDPAVAAFFGKGPFYGHAAFPLSAKK